MADPSAPLMWAEVRAALDDELARLPATLRDLLTLCYLEGLARDEAARKNPMHLLDEHVEN